MNRAYCTYFDSHYLAQGITMLRSLQQYDPHAPIHVLTFDDLCTLVLNDIFMGTVRVTRLQTLRARFPALGALSGRARWAVYATHKPAFASFTLETADAVTFIDADTWFFADPEPMYREIGNASIGLSPHRFPAAKTGLKVYGLYNAGCIFWRGDATGRQCLTDWSGDCIEWCDERLPGDGRFMNQGYLNCWPERYPGVHVIEHPGVNLAPWNLDGHRLAHGAGGVMVDDAPLIFYHFSGLTRDIRGRWHSIYPLRAANRRWYSFRTPNGLTQDVLYAPYLRAVEAESRLLVKHYGLEGLGSVRDVKITQEATLILTGS